MKLKLNKKKMKTLSSDNKTVPAAMTPQVAGGFMTVNGCMSDGAGCTTGRQDASCWCNEF